MTKPIEGNFNILALYAESNERDKVFISALFAAKSLEDQIKIFDDWLQKAEEAE